MSSEPRPAGTVVLIRDADDDLELLLLRRQVPDPAANALWVFPGGKVDAADHREGDDPAATALRAAVREAQEEAGLRLDEDSLVAISRWITPSVAPRRFDTWFFVAPVDAGAEVRVDGGEICDHTWLRPEDALAAHHRGDLRLAPPTFVTVSWLAGHGASRAALAALREQELLTFRPRICRVDDVTCILYAGDAGYGDGDPTRRGSRHRLWMRSEGWSYERVEAPS